MRGARGPSLLVVLGLLACAAILPHSRAQAVARPGIPAFAGTTTVSGAALHRVDVRLPKPAVLDFHIDSGEITAASDVTAGGSAHFPGVALSTSMPNGDPWNLTLMRLPQASFCDPGACWDHDPSFEAFGLGDWKCVGDKPFTCGKIEIPAGTYHVVLLGERGRVTTRIHLSGRRGKAALRATATSEAMLNATQPASLLPGEPWLETTGTHRFTDGRYGFGFTWLWAEDEPKRNNGGEFHGCLYDDDPNGEALPATDPGPSCLRANVDLGVGWHVLDPLRLYQWSFFSETLVCCATGWSALKTHVQNELAVKVGRRGAIVGWVPFDWSGEPFSPGGAGALYIFPNAVVPSPSVGLEPIVRIKGRPGDITIHRVTARL